MGSSVQLEEREAVGRSRSGFGTKACVTANASGRAIGFALTPGQAHELPLVPLLLAFLAVIPLWIVADDGCASHAFRQPNWKLEADRAFRPNATKLPLPVRPGSTRTTTASSACDRG
jgi:hypothetical protein